MPSALACCHTSTSTWRRTQAKLGLPLLMRSFSSRTLMFSRRASSLRCAAVASKSRGMTHTDDASTLVASIRPLRSKMRPRLPGTSMLWV